MSPPRSGGASRPTRRFRPAGSPCRGYVVKEYLVGANVGETLTRGRLGNGVVDQFGALTQLLKQHGLFIDWSPANFLVVNGALHYTAYEASPQRPDACAERQAIAPSSFGVYPARLRTSGGTNRAGSERRRDHDSAPFCAPKYLRRSQSATLTSPMRTGTSTSGPMTAANAAP
jgi:hypothetical protein